MTFTESEIVELKSQVVGDICKEIIAFANSKGGTLYIGVEDNGNVVGVENADKVTFTQADESKWYYIAKI